MKPEDSAIAFASFSNRSGVSISRCSPRQGFDLVFSFYQSVKPSGCDGPNGDMLLFQWGTYDWGNGRCFELNLTRQFSEQSFQDDDAISQLSLTFRFQPTDELESLKEGNRWCDGPSESGVIREFTLSSAAFVAVADESGAEVDLAYSHV